MKCIECSLEGNRVDAVGLCHHCSVGLCYDHGVLVADPILVHEPVTKVVVLPKRAREFLCRTCLEALRQHHAIEVQAPIPTEHAYR